ncbi:late secretory pathway protein avl9 [Ascosphaera aggregata]|nr:late secretory pathway protein avl9 [Ascosphaera aggregata]
MEDIQRKIATQVSELHLGDRVSEGREALGKHIATGHKRVVSVFKNLWADSDPERSEQRQKRGKNLSPPSEREHKRQSDGKSLSRASSRASVSTQTPSGWTYVSKNSSSDVSQGEKQQQLGTQRATSYIGSWAFWASEKRKEWQVRQATSPSVSPVVLSPRPSSVNIPANSSADSTNSGQAMDSPTSGEDAPKLTRGRSRRKRFSDMIRRNDSSHHSAKEHSQTRKHAFSTSPAPSLVSPPLTRPNDTPPIASFQPDNSLSLFPQWDDRALKRNSMPPLNSLKPLAEYDTEVDRRPSTHGYDS